MGRTYYAWEDDGRFFLSFMPRPRDASIKRPRQEFGTRSDLEAEVNKRNGAIKWEADGN